MMFCHSRDKGLAPVNLSLIRTIGISVFGCYGYSSFLAIA